MNTAKFNLSILILSMLTLGNANATDFSKHVARLNKSQQDLDERISPFRALSGFRDPDFENKSSNESQKSPILHVHNSLMNLQSPVGKLLFGRIFHRFSRKVQLRWP